MAISSLQFQQSTQVSLKNLELQMSLMANEINEIKAQKSGEELEVTPQEHEEPFLDITDDTQPEAEEEIVVGYQIEFLGIKFGLFYVASYLNLFSSLFVTVIYLGLEYFHSIRILPWVIWNK